MLCSFLRVFIAFVCFFSFATAQAQETRVVVIPLGGDDISQCAVSTACNAGTSTVSCPDGNTEIPCIDPKRVFLSSTTHTGNLGGVTGANLICQGLADNANLDGAFRAWIADSKDSPDSFFRNSSPYISTSGDIIALSYDDLTDGSPILETIDHNEFGVFIAGQKDVWTNVNTSGERFIDAPADGLRRCLNWSSTTGKGAVGFAEVTSTEWTVAGDDQFGVVDCTSNNRLYCFEQ